MDGSKGFLKTLGLVSLGVVAAGNFVTAMDLLLGGNLLGFANLVITIFMITTLIVVGRT